MTYFVSYAFVKKDGSFGFDFGGTYVEIEPNSSLTVELDDGRRYTTTFEQDGDQTVVKTTFDAEGQNSLDMQRDGWQAILNSFKAYVERTQG